jgi:hypothetical protein
MGWKEKVIGWLVPSNTIRWLNGKKRILGAIHITLWAFIYGVPIVCQSAICKSAATLGMQVHQVLVNAGLNLEGYLFEMGAALTVIGVGDWIANHWFSNALEKGLTKVEALGK